MAIVHTRDGQLVEWFPTTELICSLCREPLVACKDTLKQVNFTFDYVIPDPLERGEYWYLHKGSCSRVEDALDVSWGWHDMRWVLGLPSLMTQFYGRCDKYLKKRMPPGCYERLYEQWWPALTLRKTPRPAQKTLARAAPKIVKTYTPKIIVVPQMRKQSWRAMRFEIMKRDGYRCLLCGIAAKDDPQVRLEVDHIIPRARGGTNAPENLWTLCYECNHGKGVREL